MTTTMQRGQAAQADQARARFLSVIKEAAHSFADAAPLSVPRQQQAQAIDRVVAAFRAAAARDPKFYTATPASIGRAIALCALTGLMPGGPLPEVDLIPRQRRVRNDDGTWGDGPVEINWQIAWRGYVTMAARAGCRARPVPVYDGEEFEWREGLNRVLEHRPDLTLEEYGSWDALQAVYVVAQYRDGFRDFEVLDRRAIEKRRARSDAWKSYEEALRSGNQKRIERAASTPWVEWPIEMSLKTGMRYAGSRGLLAFDEPGQFAFAEDTKDDKADDAPLVLQAQRMAVAALPDNGFVEQVEQEQARPSKGMAAVRAAVQPQADEPPLYPDQDPDHDDPPPPSPTSVGVSTERAAAQESGTAATAKEGGQGRERSSSGPRNDVRDAEALRDVLLQTRGPGANLAYDAVKTSLKAVLKISKITDDRVKGVLQFGAGAGFWTLGAADSVVLPSQSARPQTAQQQPEDEWEDPGTPLEPALSADIGDWELHFAEAGRSEELVAAAKAAGLPVNADGPVTDGAPGSLLRRYLGELRRRAESR
jgi:recombinational DNA repair protein RecT